MGLTPEQKKLVQDTMSVMKDNGKEITTKFYATLFNEHPEFRGFFNQMNQKTGKQPMALAQTVYYFAKNIDNLDAMTPQMSRISSKHRAVTVQPEHYPIVGKYLMEAIKNFLGDKGTPETMAAWQALYDLIAETFMKTEKCLYEKLGPDERDRGFAPFTITKKDVIASGPVYLVSLERQDGGNLFHYAPGQYITVRVQKNGVFHNGHYPLLEPFNGQSYTIAFKQGNDVDQNSYVSDEIIRNQRVGSTVLVSPPAGSFGLVDNATHHLFIAGGIGITSFMAMLQELNLQGKASSVSVIQCARSDSHAAFAATLHKLLAKSHYTILTQNEPISKSHIEAQYNANTHVYISGSEVFLSMVENALAHMNIPKGQIHMKSIEPTLRILQSLD